MIIGCDLHTRYQQIAMLDMATGRVGGAAAGTRERRGQGRWPILVAFFATRVGLGASGTVSRRNNRLTQAWFWLEWVSFYCWTEPSCRSLVRSCRFCILQP